MYNKAQLWELSQPIQCSAVRPEPSEPKPSRASVRPSAYETAAAQAFALGITGPTPTGGKRAIRDGRTTLLGTRPIFSPALRPIVTGEEKRVAR